jgi:hypothetical protein
VSLHLGDRVDVGAGLGGHIWFPGTRGSVPERAVNGRPGPPHLSGTRAEPIA